MAMPNRIVPKKFFCRYPLSIGAIVASVVLIFVTLICVIALIVQVILMKYVCIHCTRYVWRNAYGFSITGVIYCFIMLVMHGWVIWGIRKRKTAVLLSWVVVSAMWLSQTFFLLITLICIHSTDINFIAWILCLIFGLIAIGILIYFILVVFGFWIEVKGARKIRVNLDAANN